MFNVAGFELSEAEYREFLELSGFTQESIEDAVEKTENEVLTKTLNH